MKQQSNNYKIEVVNPTNTEHRTQFNLLIKEAFGFDFENWHAGGYWPKSYVPHILIINGEVVANVSVYLQEITYHNQTKIYAQIGAVTTYQAHRGKGYSRILMEAVLEKYKNQTDQLFLYCHDGVTDFYKKFGFTATHETEYSLKIKNRKALETTLRKIDLTDMTDLKLLESKAKIGNQYAALKMENAYELTMFYATYFLRNDLYYLPEYDLVTVVGEKENILIITEILGNQGADLEDVIHTLVKDGIKQVKFGFTPKEKEKFEHNQVAQENTNLFIFNHNEDVTVQNHCMFPVLAHT